ncbi:hypothetical protein MUN84_10875 [Hymenobacter sp. 5516J-16]|uniref:Uncharacterized protein n=1 Tax=Hymenobacter sublimis TaxID=2933777 RepID=A0ABY4J7X8_9BACT|nr:MULTISPECIES: hypothetical protein [Hymenobacter]UOQ78974.1 hypothetical protein MUN84_10875 [Hymenobacter sp. 5516J-16]UPL48921.1 hypothetical protein MWH26_17245 [Hymenobacter sublimis]
MRRLIDALADDTDFFIEQVQITAIVFDNSDDVTIWATTYFDQESHFFHLGLPFQQLDLLLRLAGARAEALQEDVADALATVHEWPCLLEYTTDADPPVPLPNVALKLSCTYPADEPYEEGEEGEEEETFDISMDAESEEAAEYEAGQPHNIFYLEGVFLRVEP